MKIIITEEQYGHLVTNLLDLLLGNITIKTVKEKKEDGNKEDYHSVFNEDGETVMTIWVKGPLRSKGCKKDLTLENTLIEKFENYMPYYKHKMFSKVLVNYIYDKFGIKCDCVQYDYDFKEEKHVDDEGDEYEYTDSKTRRYNVKKKKKIKESVDGKSSLENLIYEFLNDDFYPDYNWGPELFDFYREDVKEHGLIPFYINDSEAYVYYDDGTLEIMPWVCEKLNEYFNDLWYSVFKSWFEENSGLKVSMMVDPRNNNRLLQESIDNSNVVEQLLDNEGIDFSISYGGRVPDKNVFYDYVYFWFKFSNTDVKPYKRVFYNTKNNKVVGIDRVPDFSTITDGFRYIPTEILNSYFVEKGEEYLNELLPIEYPKHNKLNESTDNSNVVEQIMEVEGVKYDGCGYGGRTYDNFGRRHDTVEVYFKLPDEEKLYSRRIHFFTRKNKVVSVDSTGDFRTITDGFRYIPTDILMGYFIEKAKTYVERLLRTLYPNDSR